MHFVLFFILCLGQESEIDKQISDSMKSARERGLVS